MSTPRIHPDATQCGLLDEVVGYLNFSSGASDPKFLRNLNALFCDIEAGTCREPSGTCRPRPRADSRKALAESPNAVDVLCDWLNQRVDHLAAHSPAFRDVAQAQAVVQLLRGHLLPAYRAFHLYLLWHQSDDALWRPLFLGRAFEAILSQGGPWEEVDRIVERALDMLNDYIGYRPVAVLESERQMEPYAHERVRPIPLYVQEVGVGCGVYQELVERALGILREIDPEIRQQAWFDPELMEELALDPRAYDFDHPASKRPNHHFGQWDLHRVDNRGYYRRFVLQQITLDALLTRVEAYSGGVDRSGKKKLECDGPAAVSRDELLFEAAAVLAGTILMASGTTGNGPGCHGSDVTLSSLLPHIAAYRDQFYDHLLARTSGPHGERLRAEAKRTRQPFGGARQHLNHELARRRAAQMQHVHLALLYARMRYPEAALEEAHSVQTASARILCHIYCLLTAGHQAIDSRQLEVVAQHIPEIENLLERGIECGALVDPWNIVGFAGNFSLFPAIENTVHDFRVDDLIELVEQILDLCARAWTEAAATEDEAREPIFSTALERIAAWWDKYATASVSGVKRLVGKEIEVSTNLVAGALAAWNKAGAAAGDVKFWRLFVDQFDSPKAFQLVVEALLERGDQVASMALMLQWVSQADYTPLEDGDASFHPLALRWLRAVADRERATASDQWPLVAKFFEHLEASAEAHWQVPAFELLAAEIDDELFDEDLAQAQLEDEEEAEDDELWDDGDEQDELFSAAYEDMVYRDSTDDGLDADLLDEFTDGTQYELEEEAQRLGQRLEFLTTVARLWRQVALTWSVRSNDPSPATQPEESTSSSADSARRQLLDRWCQEAVVRQERLLELVESIHRYPLPQPRGSHESLIEFDRQRMIKESLLEQVISTCVETAGAGRLLRAAAGPLEPSRAAGSCSLDGAASLRVLRGLLIGDPALVRLHWGEFTRWLSEQELLYVPLGKGGRAKRIVRARRLSQFLDDLLGWLPRLGLIRETCQLLDLAQGMEADHPVGPGAITEYDRLFARGYQAMVRALVASAEQWGREGPAVQQQPPDLESPQSIFRQVKNTERITSSSSDMMLVEALKDLTESQLNRWLTHSRTLRLSVVERLSNDSDWDTFVRFIERYGKDIFTQKFLNLGNLRAILHQRVSVWLSNLEEDPNYDEWRLVEELGSAVSHEEAAKWLTIAIEAVVENYREYRDYNTITTQSDHGELLYTLIDFLRLRANYDRVAWNLRPVVMAHEILVRQKRPLAAELWQQELAERTADTADVNLTRFDELCTHYGIRLPTIAERLNERFTRPLAIDRVRALVGAAITAADTGDPEPFAALKQEIAVLAQEPAGAGLDLPDWLEALEEEVSSLRCRRRSRQGVDDVPRHLHQVRLSWEGWQQQIVEDAT